MGGMSSTYENLHETYVGEHISEPVRRELTADRRHIYSSGVSWGAVIAGAFTMAAVSLILLALGAGFGLAAISPWSNAGISAATFGAGAIIWLIIVEAASAALGGYLAGRLRTRWQLIHNHEVHFRDTANGFLAWAVALVLTVTFLSGAAAYMAGASAGLAAPPVVAESDTAYHIDRMLQPSTPRFDPADAAIKSEASRFFVDAVASDDPADISYLTQLVAMRTGLSPAESQQRVNQIVTEAKTEADAARKSASRLLLWTFVALLCGAFCASYAATIGGRQRDRVVTVEG